jgi:protein ImuB
MAVRMAVVWCPDWPVRAAGVGEEPAAVVEAGRVVACSAAARAEGVRRGFRRRQAEARCPGLVVLAPDPARDARAFEPVVAAVETFTPSVEIIRPGMCAFATRGPARYFGGEEALAEKVAATVGECRVGIADGRFAAERAARRGQASCLNAVVVIQPGHSPAFLAPFPVATLGHPDLADLLVRLGIRTLGQLAALPAPAVLARFGAAGRSAHRLARGLDERPLAAHPPNPDLAVATEIDPPADRMETIAFLARSLAAELHTSLAAQGLAAGLVRIEAETEHGESLSRTWRLEGAAGGGAAALAERVRWQLDGWITSSAVTGALTLLRLVPEEMRPDGGRQDGFWGGDRGAAEQVARALARVQGRFGPEAVATARVVGGRSLPEQVCLVPWGEAPPGDVLATAVLPWPGRLPPPAPATVLPAPVPAAVVDATGAPVAVSGRGLPSAAPARLAVGGGPFTRVAAWAGPWPVEERWWDPGASRRRARWQVLTEDGVAYLAVLEGGGWWIEASYD